MTHFIASLRKQKNLRHSTGASRDEVVRAEMELGLSFFSDYREYLTEFGIASANGHEFTGLCASPRLNVVSVTRDQRKRHAVPNDFYVVEEAGIDDIVVWQASSGELYQTVPGREPILFGRSLSELLVQ